MKRIITLVLLAICSLIQQIAYAQPPGNRGMYFDGVDDYVNCGTTINTVLNSNAFTIEGWIKLSNIGTNILLSNRTATNGGGFEFIVLN